MRVVRESQIDGTFDGYRRGNVYRLIDGSSWVQTGPEVEFLRKEGPLAWLLANESGGFFLDVAGTSGVARVRPA